MSIIPKTVNPDLQKERQNATLDVEDFALWWHGGTEKLKFKRELGKVFVLSIENETFVDKDC